MGQSYKISFLRNTTGKEQWQASSKASKQRKPVSQTKELIKPGKPFAMELIVRSIDRPWEHCYCWV